MKTTPLTSPHHVRRQLLACPEAYVESVGKTDINTLGLAADAPNGTGTVLRLIMGATEIMPLRALSYVDSAIRIARIIPCEQLQIVHANRLGAGLNHLSLERAQDQSKKLAVLARFHIAAVAPELGNKVLHANDAPHDIVPLFDLAQQAVENTEIGTRLLEKGTKHGGNALAYASAHFAFQDTDALELEPLLPDQPKQARAERIVSIGCQQERLFYAARMAMRSIAHETPLVDSAQIFTRHVTPPYFVARGGEQSLDDAFGQGVDLSIAGDASTRRDLAHLEQVINEEITHG